MPIHVDDLRYKLEDLKASLPALTKRQMIILGGGVPVAIILLIVALIVWWPSGGPAKPQLPPEQIAARQKAETFKEQVQTQFPGVRVNFGQPDPDKPEGSYFIWGTVDSEESLEALNALVSAQRGRANADLSVSVTPGD